VLLCRSQHVHPVRGIVFLGIHVGEYNFSK
jgi:hypothetical protein